MSWASPPTDPKALKTGSGTYNDFAKGGSIYNSAASGAREVFGAIRTKWRALGAEHGLLGYPTTNQKPTSSNNGFFNDFKGGSIYSSPATGAHETHGLIRTKWLSLGAQKSKYGYPTSDVVAITGGSRQTFQHGTLTLRNGKVT